MSMRKVSEVEECGLEGKVVGPWAEAADATEGEIGEEGTPTELLARLGFGEMNLDERELRGEEGVAQDDARMRESCRVQDTKVGLRGRVLVEEVDQSPLVVALKGEKPMPLGAGSCLEAGADDLEALRAVEGDLAPTEEVEIWAVDEENGGHRVRRFGDLEVANVRLILQSYTIRLPSVAISCARNGAPPDHGFVCPCTAARSLRSSLG
jgi:hypothetical protein